jgi:hypothetical protein
VAFNFIGPLRSKFNTDTLVLDLDRLQKPITKEFRGENDEVLTI